MTLTIFLENEAPRSLLRGIAQEGRKGAAASCGELPDPLGIKEVLGLWVAQTEGAKFWLSVVTELKNRGVQDIFIACVDRLKGLPEAIETVFPNAEAQ